MPTWCQDLDRTVMVQFAACEKKTDCRLSLNTMQQLTTPPAESKELATPRLRITLAKIAYLLFASFSFGAFPTALECSGFLPQSVWIDSCGFYLAAPNGPTSWMVTLASYTMTFLYGIASFAAIVEIFSGVSRKRTRARFFKRAICISGLLLPLPIICTSILLLSSLYGGEISSFTGFAAPVSAREAAIEASKSSGAKAPWYLLNL